jgi:hypothetical protein
MKPWYLSKTVWANVAATLTALAGLAGLFPPEVAPWLMTAAAVINIVLRIWFTDTGIEKPQGPESIG